MNKLNETPEHQLAKYQELYTLAKGVFAEELERSASIERKAANYISILTFLIGVFGFFSRQVLGVLLPPKTMLSWLILLVLIVFVAIMVWTWFTLFRILRLYYYKKLPIPLEFFHENKLATVYYGMAKGIKENLEINRQHGDKKGQLLDRAYDLMRFMVVLLVVLCVLFGAHAWVNASANTRNANERRSQMSEKTENTTPDQQAETPQAPESQEGPQQAETLPDVDVTPPVFDTQVNAAKPPKTKIIPTKTKDD